MVAFYDQLLARVEALPPVATAGFTRFLPMSDGPWTFAFELEGPTSDAARPETRVGFHAVSGDYFRASQIPLVQGRLLSPVDDAGAVPVVLVNETMARRYWPGAGPLGKRIRFEDAQEGFGQWRTIVGVVADVKHEGLRRDAIPTVYGPLSQAFPVLANRMRLVVRTAGDPLALASTVRSIVGELDPDLPVFAIRSTEEIVSAHVARPRFSMLVLAGFAAVAAILALVGVHGVVSYSVGQRTREIGLRMALGAQVPRLVGRVALEGMALTGLGIGIGGLGAVTVTPLAESLFFGVESSDPLTYGAAAALLGVAASLACLLPATRAARVDPASVIKGD
jgi:putative ABC transport system permease protein